MVDKTLVESLAEAFTSNTNGTGTPLDRLYNTSNALKAWFENWFAVPVSAYYCQPAAVAAQIVYALTMLGRWAQLSTPRPHVPEARGPDDNTPESQGLYSFELNRRNTTGSVKSPGDKVHSTREAFESGQALPPCQVDPDLTAAVASLQSQLQSHPELIVDIPEILSAISNRFEQANATFQISSADNSKVDNNVWSMTALKVRITRARLEKWAELVSKEGENHSPGQQLKADMDTSMSDWGMNFPATSGGPMPDGTWDPSMNTSMPPDQMQMQNNIYGSTPWRGDLLTGVDPTVWFDGYLDWNTIIMNSMGTVGQ